MSISGDHGGGKRGEDRSRHVEGDRESEGSQRKGATSSNAWAKGKPSSLGGPQKPIILKRKVEEEAPVRICKHCTLLLLYIHCVVHRHQTCIE